MEKTTMYMAKIDREEFVKWKENNGRFNGRLMFQIWVEYLSKKENFNKFLNSVKEEEKERTLENLHRYKLTDLNYKNWNLFMNLCRDNDVFANDIVNILIRRFNNQGWCVETEMKV